MHHASKCSPYPVQSRCIHWLHIVRPILFPVHNRTSNLGFWICPKCVSCTCPSYRVSFPHILVNLLLSCLPRPIILRNKVWNISVGTLPLIWRALYGDFLSFAPAIPSLVNFAFPLLLVLNKGLNLLTFGRYLEIPIFLHIPPPEFFHGELPRCLHSLGCSIALALWLNPIIYSVLHPLLILLNKLWGVFLVTYLLSHWVPVADQKTVSFPPILAKLCGCT